MHIIITEAGIDKEVLYQIDDTMVNELFDISECGYKKKFLNRLSALIQNDKDNFDKDLRTP